MSLTWNSEDHEYDNLGWAVVNEEDEEDGNLITIYNNSNVQLNASIEYKKENNLSPINGYLILDGEPDENMNNKIVGNLTIILTD